ncbi:electron transport protein [Bacillus sonorensis]|uniref:electron transport protein n=1 Tax=Bacillus sonorensis TaxID=119858 RepID=UPI001F42FDCA|nr:electron transport protein [Bacillus sonorensis]MCF7618326.1 electron transport protein [Bacillus sonorensis]
MRKHKWLTGLTIVVVLLAAGYITIRFLEPEYAYMPPKEKVISKESRKNGYDMWGRFVSNEEARRLGFSSKNGAVKVDDQLYDLGRETFYKETFGNEVFLTDILGLIDGPITFANMTKAITELKGKGTTNLRVELAKTANIGGRTYKKGEKIDTGIDVPKGAYAPLGMPFKYSDGKIKVGISCAACHATTHPKTMQVMEGVTNPDLNTGLMLALATNSAAYFTHSEIKSIKQFINGNSPVITGANGRKERLPDPDRLEKAVDQVFLKWPRGYFDSTIDMKSNPTQIPDAFTLGDHPYSWSGAAMAGPFKGLSVFSNNVHAQNSDSLSQVPGSQALFGMSRDVYLGTILQRAASKTYRYHPKGKDSPSAFFAKADPTPGAPGVNELIKPPSFPKITMVAPDGVNAGSSDRKANEENNAMAAWQNTLSPPEPPRKANEETIKQGRAVFEKAGCISCHAGRYLTNNKVVSAKEIGTEPTRAQSFKKTEKLFGKSTIYAPNTNVPVKNNAKVLKVPTGHFDKEQIELAWAKNGSPGGYKVPSLIGLYWSAPYLHDGGAAVGSSLTEAGIPETLAKGKPADPYHSLLALIDRDLRQRVIKSNAASPDARAVRVTGKGHEFWIDQKSGFSKKEQKAVIDYLMSLDPPKNETGPP